MGIVVELSKNQSTIYTPSRKIKSPHNFSHSASSDEMMTTLIYMQQNLVFSAGLLYLSQHHL